MTPFPDSGFAGISPLPDPGGFGSRGFPSHELQLRRKGSPAPLPFLRPAKRRANPPTDPRRMDLLPANASPLKLHRQAKRLLRSTSRAKEPDWYRRAHQLDLQWHLWIGAHSGVSAVYRRSLRQWWEGPDLPPLS